MIGQMYINSGIPERYIVWLIPFAVLDIVLRGFSLWKSARKDQQWWFVALLVVNSLGILPAIYLLIQQENIKSAKKKK